MLIDKELSDRMEILAGRLVDHLSPDSHELWMDIHIAIRMGIHISMRPLCEEMLRQGTSGQQSLLERLKPLWYGGSEKFNDEMNRQRLHAMSPIFEAIDDL